MSHFLQKFVIAESLAFAARFQVDHVIAEQHGGLTPWLFNPRRQKWAKHFRWQGPILMGRTPVGRATITVLGINLPHRVAQRAALIMEGAFPTL